MTRALTELFLGLCLAVGLSKTCLAGNSPYRLDIRNSDFRLHFPGHVKEAGKAPLRGVAALIERHAQARGLDPALVHAVVGTESAYRSDAVSIKGAVGLMQLMPDTARRFGVTDLTDPDANLRAGTAYLSHLLDLFKDLPLALAAYNAGEGAVISHGYRIPPYPETQAYVRDILRKYSGRSGGGIPRSIHMEDTRLDTGIDLSPYRLRLK